MGLTISHGVLVVEVVAPGRMCLGDFKEEGMKGIRLPEVFTVILLEMSLDVHGSPELLHTKQADLCQVKGIFRRREDRLDVTLEQVEMKAPVKEKCIWILSVNIEVGASALVNVGFKVPMLLAVHTTMGTHTRPSLGVTDTTVGSMACLNMLLQCKEGTKRFGTV